MGGREIRPLEATSAFRVPEKSVDRRRSDNGERSAARTDCRRPETSPDRYRRWRAFDRRAFAVRRRSYPIRTSGEIESAVVELV